VGAAFVLVLLRRQLGSIGGARVFATVIRVSVAATASAAAALGVLGLWELPAGAGVLPQALQVGAAVSLGVLVFLISALILRVGEVDDLKKALVRRFRP
jgi:peptidoglycan biosynthesis protein MviN/MurJ (putative lipid II flippase)